MIRPATLMDVDAIYAIAVRETHRYSRMKPSAEKIRKAIIHVISSAKHFCWVSADEQERVSGVIIGLVNENLWAQRQSCNILLWAAEIAGDGVRLLKIIKTWVTSRRAIKVIGFAPDTDDVDPRTWDLVQRMGFKRYGGAYLLYN